MHVIDTVLKCHFKAKGKTTPFHQFFLHVYHFLPTFADVSLRQKNEFQKQGRGTTRKQTMMNDNMSTNIFYGSNHDDLHFDSSEYGDSLYGAPDPVALDAAAVVARLVRLPAGSVRWRGSKRCLVELVARAAEARVLTDGRSCDPRGAMPRPVSRDGHGASTPRVVGGLPHTQQGDAATAIGSQGERGPRRGRQDAVSRPATAYSR